MRSRVIVAAALLSISTAFAAVKGSKVTVVTAKDAPPVRAVTGLEYETFHEAAAFWDIEAAGRFATRQDQRDYLAGIRALMQGDEAGAETRLRAARDATDEEIIRALSTRLLEQLYYADGRWDRYRGLESDATADDPFRVLVESLTDGPAPELTIPAEPTVVPTTPDAGLPTLRVSVNGEPFDFILDTGAPFSVINADVAEAAGVVPVGDRTGVIRNDVRGRPARIERLALGDVVSTRHPVMIVPTEGLTIPERPSPNKTVQGILGWPLIRRLDLEIDLAGGTTTIRRPVPDENAGERNLFFCFRPIVVARDAKGMPLHFMLDTGTDATTLFRRIGKKTALGKSKPVKLGSSRIGELRRELDARLVKRLVVHVGGRRVAFGNIPLFHGSSTDGMLGTDVHADGRVRIDYVNGRYSLEP